MSRDEIARALAGANPVEIMGTGSFAEALRPLFPPAQAGVRPALIIETSGDLSAIEAALQSVDDLGTVVLAGPLPETPIRLDLYPDVHVRGLTLVGIARDDPLWDELGKAGRQ